MIYATFSLNSPIPLSNIEITSNLSCLGKDPTIVWTPDGDIIVIWSPISILSKKLKSFPIEIELFFKSVDPKYFWLFDISSFLKSSFKYPFKRTPFVFSFERITASPSFETMPLAKSFSTVNTKGLS